MEDLFIPFDLAVKLKNLGFNEPCIAIYSNANSKTGLYTEKKYKLKLIRQESQADKGVKAPIFSQCFKWFRENYRLSVSIIFVAQEYFYEIRRNGEQFIYMPEGYETYETAELDMLYELIKTVESELE